jgi:hypothetical protein
MSQLNVNVVAPLGYTGPNLPGNSNFVQVVDTTGDTVLKIPSGNNIAIGKDALNTATTGQRNIAIGTSAALNANGSDNIAIGNEALLSSPGGGNVGIGRNSLRNLTTNSFNTAVGNNSLVNAGSVTTSAAFGSAAGSDITSGNSNAFLGSNSGAGFSSGDFNVFVGCQSASASNLQTGNNNILISGWFAYPSSVNVDNEITLGNSQHTVLRCAQTSITSLSDARDKKEIEELPVGLDFVKGLKPVKFVWDERDENGRHEVKDFGFIAQDLKKSQEDAELAETLKLVYESNPEKLEASYGKLIPILVKAIQELSEEVKQLKNK